MDLNRATVLGRLTRDPELRTTNSGKSVASMSLATNRTWTDQSGQKQEQSEFHNCVLWGKTAEIAAQYLTKGRRAYVEGRLQTRDWTDQSGVKKYRTEIVVDNMIMLDGGQRSGNDGPSNMGGSNPPPMDDQGGNDEIKVEDIPF